MTTPARNVNVTTQHFGIQTTQTGTNPPVVNDHTYYVTTGRFIDQRPASKRNVVNTQKWRSPSSWNHYGYRGSAEYGDVTYIRPNRSPTLLNLEQWTDGSFWGGFNAIPNMPAWSFPSKLENMALVKALNKLKDQQIHLGNFIAEAHQALNMLASTINLVASSVSAYKQAYPRSWNQVKRWQVGNLPRPRWREIPNSWLQVQYGWTPLMSDLFGALSALDARWSKTTPLICVRAMAGDKFPDSTLQFLGRYGSYSRGHWEWEHRVSVSLWYTLANLTLAFLSSLGLINPLEIVWEITKYSFVIDWFLPIGSWLSSLTGDTGYSFKGGTCSRRSQARWTQEDVFIGSKPGFDGAGGSVQTTGETNYFERSVYPSSPVPGLYFKNPLSLGHVANATALLTQAFR